MAEPARKSPLETVKETAKGAVGGARDTAEKAVHGTKEAVSSAKEVILEAVKTPPEVATEPPNKETKKWTSFMHASLLLGVLIPIAGLLVPFGIWLAKKSESSFIAKQGKEIFNFCITVALATLVSSALTFFFLGYVLLTVVGIYAVVMPIVGAIKASNGEFYRYPFCLRLIH